MQVPGNHNTCRASVVSVETALDAMIHRGRANMRIPEASGAMPHPMADGGNAAARGPANVPPRKLVGGIPGSHNGVKGMLA